MWRIACLAGETWLWALQPRRRGMKQARGLIFVTWTCQDEMQTRALNDVVNFIEQNW
jgi:hypothetical protein